MAGPGDVNLLHGGHLIAGAAPSFAADNGSTTAAVSVRSGPDTGYPLAGKEPAGAQLTLQRQGQDGISAPARASRSASMSPPNAGPSTATAHYPRPAPPGTTAADGANSSPSKPRASSSVILPPARIIRRS